MVTMDKAKKKQLAFAILTVFAVLVVFAFVFYNLFSPSREMAGSIDNAAQEQKSDIETPKTPMLLKKASVTVLVDEGSLNKKFAEAQEIAQSMDGYTTDSEVSTDIEGEGRGSILIHVPADRFEEAINKLKKLGTVKLVSITAEDVTEEYVDIESRLRNYQVHEAKLIDLMGKATTVEETLKVESQLVSVQKEIEVIKGRKEYLETRVEYSTIETNIEEPGAYESTSERWKIGDAFDSAITAFLGTINVVIILTGVFLPLFALFLVGYGVWKLWKIIKAKRLK